MTGTYADYGRFKINETSENETIFKTFLKYLKSLAYRTKEGENPYHDLPVDIPALIQKHNPEKGWEAIHELWEEIHDLNHDNRIFIHNNIHRGPPRLLQTAVICEGAWQALLKDATGDFEKQWKKIEEAVADPKAAVSAALDKPHRDGTEKEYDEEFREGFFEHLLKNQFDRLDGWGEGEYNLIRHPIKSYDAARMIVRGDALDKVRALIKPIAEEAGIKRHLTDLGVKLLPHAYAGQDYDNYSGTKLNMIALRVMIEQQKARASLNYGDGFLSEEPEEDEDSYITRDRKKAALFQKLEGLVDELEGLTVEDE